MSGFSPAPTLLTLARIFEDLQRRRNLFVSYHHKLDQLFYNSLTTTYGAGFTWFQNNSVEERVQSTNSDYIYRRISENHITGSSCTIVLCGQDTPWRKHVDWEVKATLDKQHGLIALILPTIRQHFFSGKFLVGDRIWNNIFSGYAVVVWWEEIVREPAVLKIRIEEAITKPNRLICNSLSMFNTFAKQAMR